MSRARRKKQIRNRIIAFVMAVAMVFTVVKVNDSKKVVKAGEGSTEGVTDSSYLASSEVVDSNVVGKIRNIVDSYTTVTGSGKASLREVFNTGYTVPEYNIYVQNDKVSFILPQSSVNNQGSAESIAGLHYNTYFIHMNSSDLVADEAIPDGYNSYNNIPGGEYITAYYHFWYNNLADDKITIGKGNAIVTYTAKRTLSSFTPEKDSEKYSGYDSDFTSAFETSTYDDPSTDNDVFTVKYNTSDAGYTINASTGSISDTWGSGAGTNDFYYGHNEFVVSNKELTEDELKTADSYTANYINTHLDDIYAVDGANYYVYQRYYTEVDESKDPEIVDLVYYTNNTPTVVTTDNKLHTTVKYAIADGNQQNLVDIERQSVTFNPETDSYNVISEVNPASDVTFTLNTDAEASYTLKKGSDTVESGDLTETEENSGIYGKSIVIAGNASTNNGATNDYVLTISTGTGEGAISQAFGIKVKYLDTATFDLSNVKINSEDATCIDEGSALITKEDSLEFTADFSRGDGYADNTLASWISISDNVADNPTVSMTLTEQESSGPIKKYSATGTYTFAEGVADGSYTFTLTPGYGTGENAVSVGSNAKTYYVLRDTIAPALDTEKGVTATQTGNTTGKYTTQKAVNISFELVENGSGVDNNTVKIKYGTDSEVSATYNEGVYTASVPSTAFASLVDAGGSFAYTIVASDIAGNSNIEVYKGSITFVKEKYEIEITPKFKVGEEYISTTVSVGEGEDAKPYAKAGTSEIVFNITITSDFEISVTDPSTESDTKVKDVEGKIKAKFYNSNVEANTDLYVISKASPSEQNSYKYVYVLESAPLSTLPDGTYSIKVQATNSNDYTPADWDSSTLIYVDLTSPNPSLQGVVNNAEEWSADDDTTFAPTTTGAWYKNVYVIVSGVQDVQNTPTDYSTGVKLDTITVTGMTLDNDHSIPASGIFVYQVNPSVWDDDDTSIDDVKTDVSFTVSDNIGNAVTPPITGTFYVDNLLPTITNCKVKEGEREVSIANGSTVIIKEDALISAIFADNINLYQPKIRCTGVPSGSGITPGEAIVDTHGEKSYELNEVSLKDVLGVNSETNLVEGNYVIEISTKDLTKVNSATITFTLVVDKSGPEIDIDVSDNLKSTPTGKTYSASHSTSDYKRSYTKGENTFDYYKYANDNVTVTVTVTDPHITSPADQIKVYNGDTQISISADDWNHSEGTNVYSTDIVLNTDGDYDITVLATDDSLNSTNTKDTTQELEFAIDRIGVPPTVILTGTKPTTEEIYSSDVAASYGLNDPNKDTFDVSGVYSFTPAGTGTAVEDQAITFTDGVASFGGEGSYSVTVTAVDMAGNSVSSTKTFIIDKTEPVADIEVDSNLKNTAPKTTGDDAVRVKNAYNSGSLSYEYYKYSQNNVTLTFTVRDYNISTNDIVVMDGSNKINGLVWSQSSSDKTLFTATKTFDKTTDQGVHSITISATDKVTKTSVNNQTVSFTIDSTQPDLVLKMNGTSNPNNDQRINGKVVIAYDLSDTNNDSGDVTLKYTHTPNGQSAKPEVIESGFKNKEFVEEGSYSISVIAVDKAGNSSTKTLRFVIDNTVPEIDIAKIQGSASKAGKFGSVYSHSGKQYNTSYSYGLFYNSDVTLTVNVFDYDLTFSDEVFEVTDNGKKVADAKFTKKGDYEYTATFTISKPDDGVASEDHDVKITAYDKVGSNHKGNNEIKFTIDTTKPSLDLTLNGKTDPKPDVRVDDDVTIGYTLEDSNKDLTDVKITYVFTPAGESKKPAETETLYNGSTKKFTANGTYEVTITAIDKAGNSSNDKASFVIDKQKPEIDLKITTSKPAKFDKYKRTYKPAVENYFTTAKDGYEYGQYYKDNVKVKISVFDYDVKGTVVYDNEDEVEVSFKYEGDGLYTGEFTISEEGSHVIKAESVDKSGNTGKSSELSFIIDKTAPALTTTLDGETYSGTDRFCASDAVVGLKIDEKNNDADDVLRAYVIKPSDHSAETSDTSYVTALQETYKQNAYYTVTYTVVDRAGNSSTAKIGFTIDNTKPQSDIRITTKAPAKIDKYHNEYSNTNGHFNTAYTYGQYYNESVAMDMAVFDYNVSKIVVTDNDEVIPVTFSGGGDERTASSVTVSDEGEHVVKIIVTDMSGNEAVSKSVSFIIDKSAPSLSATLNNMGSITEQYLASDASVYLSVSDANKDEDDVTRVVKITRPSASTESSTETGALEGTVGYNTEADYEIVYTAIDRAGNESEPITLTFRVDKTAPALSITGITRDATSPENVTITYSMVEDFYWDVESAVVKIYKKVDGMGESPYKTVDFKAGSANSSMSETFEEDGEYRFEFTAKDKTGNEANETFRFILDKNAPIIILSGVDDYLTDKDVTFGVQVDETFYLGNNVKIEGTIKTLENPDGKKLEIDDYTRLTRTSSANFEQIFKEDGIYNIKVTSKDSAGNETVQSVQFTIDKTKPLIKNLEELADEEEYAAYVEATENHEKDAKKLIPIFNEFNFDYDADDIVTDLTTVTYKLYMDGVLYDGLSDVADGFHELRITAEDEVGNTAERTFYFMLDTVKPGIIVTGVEEGDNLMEPTTITVSLQLAEDTLKAVAINGQEVAITNNTATIEVSEKGDYVLVIEAVDDAGNESTMTIKFEYGKTSSWLWLIIAGGAALLIAAAAFFIILGKKRKKNQ